MGNVFRNWRRRPFDGVIPACTCSGLRKALESVDRSGAPSCFCQAMNLRVPEKQVPFASPLDGVTVYRVSRL